MSGPLESGGFTTLSMPRIIQPLPGDTLVIGHAYNIRWEMPDRGKGPATVQLYLEDGGTRISLAEHYQGEGGLPILPWIPGPALGASSRCSIDVRSEVDTTMHACMSGYFNLRR